MRIGDFAEAWVADTEFTQPEGCLPDPICLVARELQTGRTFRLWIDELRQMRRPPFDIGPRSVFVPYAAVAELQVFKVLGWPMPVNVLDIFFECRNLTNGIPGLGSISQLKAAAHFGTPHMDTATKNAMRDIAIRGGPYTAEEREGLLRYCEGDVTDLTALTKGVVPQLRNLGQSLNRGRFAIPQTEMENAGVPIDVPTLTTLRERWEPMKLSLIEEVDRDFGCYEGTSFRTSRFRDYLERTKLAWPTLPSGELDLSDDAFKPMSVVRPALAPLRELRNMIGSMSLFSLTVGPDGRNRTSLRPFGSRTGRNQPSNTRFIFGPSCYLRSLIKPEGPDTGHEPQAIAYVDWSQQEVAVGAALSGDTALQAVYRDSDPYLSFGKLAGIVPQHATKETHELERERLKQCVLGVSYGMSSYSLAARIEQMEPYARELLQYHRRTFERYWQWVQAATDVATLHLQLRTCFGWTLNVTRSADPWKPAVNHRSVGNWPCQSHGAEMLRLACCLIVDKGVQLLAPVHDAVLVGGPAKDIEEIVAVTQACMAEAGRIVLDGFEVKSDAKIVRWPDRYWDARGVSFWNRVARLAGIPEVCIREKQKADHAKATKTAVCAAHAENPSGCR